jgi:Flp pilus assembly protein TadD
LAVVAAATLSLLAIDVDAQTPSKRDEASAPLPSEFTEDARRSYAKGLAEARDLIAGRRFDDAIAKLDALSQARPREAQARFLKAVAQSDQGKAADAIATLRELVADFPELPEPRNNLAVLYAAQGNYTLAREELELAIAAAPDYALAHENLGDVYARLAALQYERAIALDKANRTAPQKLKLSRELLSVLAVR